MVKIKHSLFAVVYFVITIQPLISRSEMTEAKYACNIVEFAIWSEILSQGKDLPSSWEDIPSFRDMKENLSAQNLDTLGQINSLVLVPNSPVIQPEPGIVESRLNHKLFAIGRIGNLYDQKSTSNNESPDKGRYAILVTLDNSQISSSWLLEPEVQIILKQITLHDKIFR